MGLRKLNSRGMAAAAALSAFVGGLCLAGCNLYAPLAADNRGDLTYRGLILKGNAAINSKDYPAAQGYFEQAMAMNPRGSEAYLFHSKALMKRYSLDFTYLNGEFEAHRTQAGQAPKKGVPFIDSTTTLAGADSIYYPIATSVSNLEHILRRSRDTLWLDAAKRWKLPPDGDTAADGAISEGVARLDLGLLQAVKALLAPLDLDFNMRLDSACGRNICPTLGAPCTGGKAYLDRCAEGPLSEARRFDNFKKLTARVDLENLDSKDVNARHVSTNPNDINAFLDAMQGPITASNFNLDSVTGTMDANNEQAMSKQLDDVTSNIKDLNSFLGYMRYNDGLDGDFDAQPPLNAQQKPSTLMWWDFNKDNAIRHDYSDGSFQNLDPEGANMGHPLHRWRYPHLYMGIADYKQTYPIPAAELDTVTKTYKKNSRIALMIKRCEEIIAPYANAAGALKSAYDDMRARKTCDSVTSVIRKEVRPPALSDWRRGTPGVDEEMIDEHDNDYDGLKDEDARNAKLLDDDDDATVDTSMIDDVQDPLPMAWRDAATHANQCPDIDLAVPMPAFPYQRRNCIGSLEHRIFLAQSDSLVVGNDTLLSRMYSEFTGTERGPHINCLEDFLKLPVEYRRPLGEDTTTRAENVKNRSVRTACRFKHIWKLPIPGNSEWTSGVFGIDEEKMDGVDNDGDGWKDEDVE